MRNLITFLVVVFTVVMAGVANAGAPFNNLQGVGGVGFNPLAYVAEGEALYKIGDTEILSTPRFGTWYVHLGDPKIDWEAMGGATTLFKRLEVSYGYENISWVGHPTFHKDNVGAKFLVLPENSFGTKFLPAISVGTIYKATDDKYVHPLRSTGEDWYAVATKTITQLPLPVIISSGVLSSSEFVTGVLGFDNKRKVTSFENVDVVLPHHFLTGYEFKQGEQYATIKNNNYWDAHVGWMPNKNLTLCLAYVVTGGYGKAGNTRTGLGNGPILSAQYQF